MDAIALVLSKFSDELLAAQTAVLSSIAALTIAWLLIRRRERRSSEWVPASLVKSYLDKVDHDEREIRYKLFGEQSAASPSMTTVVQQVVSGDNSAFTREIEALRAQLGAADSRAAELDKGINGLRSEKTGLEKKIAELEAARAAAAANPGAAPATADPAAAKELEDLKAKLAEYEVIEDDLANLKKFQSENKLLKEKIESLEKAMAGSLAAPKAAAPVSEPVAAAPTPTLTVVPTPAAEPVSTAAEKSPKQKEDELLSEFEKMLAS